MPFAGIVFPRAEDYDTTCSDAIKEIGGWFIIIAETIIGKHNDRVSLRKQDVQHVFLLGRNKR